MDTPDVLAWRDGYIEALDQTALPHQVRMLRITTVDQLVEAITTLAVRGAPVLGAAGALGVALAVRQGGREGWDAARLDAEVKRIADARPTAVNLRREVTAVAGTHSAGPRGRGGGGPGRGRFGRRGQRADQLARRRLAEAGLRARAAPHSYPLQHRQPGLPGLGHGARRDPRPARRRRAGARDRGRDQAAAPGRPADLLGAWPARHRAPAGLRRGGAVPDQPGAGRRGGGRRRPGGGQRRRGQQDRHLQPGPGRARGGHPVPGRGARVHAGPLDAVRFGHPDRAAGGRGGHRAGRAARNPRAQLRVRHHPGRARLRGGDRGAAYPSLLIPRSPARS